VRITTLDTTLRAGLEAEGISFSLEDKLAIAAKLDDFGIDLIEADAADAEFFHRARLKRARLAGWAPDEASLSAAIASGAPVVVVASASAIPVLKAAGRQVVFHAEHFFDRYRDDQALALQSLDDASGADIQCLCDTRGGTLPREVAAACAAVRERFSGVLGIRAWNDSDVAVANTLAAVECGFTHVEGSVNGYGPRCGLASIESLIGDLAVKLGHTFAFERPEGLT
jgi:2-isopropylmalate synthase